MSIRHATAVAGVLTFVGLAAWAHHAPDPPRLRFPRVPGALVQVSIRTGGSERQLYPAPDGSGRYYFEARSGDDYEIVLANRSHERLGAVLSVDGLNAISGTRSSLSASERMYVLGPWDETVVRGWRSSLHDVHRFSFVDERRSYAARTGQASGKLGWVEVAVFRERPHGVRRSGRVDDRFEHDRLRDEPKSRDEAAAAPAPSEAGQAEFLESTPEVAAAPRAKRESYPGTGWGERTYDPVQVVRFEPVEPAAERIVLRYEYAPALQALGIDLGARHPHARLRERERGHNGFARPPRRD